MNTLNPGDVIAFRLRGATFGAAQVVHIEKLTNYDNYHLKVLDVLLQAREESDEMDDNLIYIEDPSPAFQAPVFLDHLAVTYDVLSNSDVIVIGESDVSDQDLEGYYVWLESVRRNAGSLGWLSSSVRGGVNNVAAVKEDKDEDEEVDEDGADEGDEKSDDTEESSQTHAQDDPDAGGMGESEPEPASFGAYPILLQNSSVGMGLIELQSLFAEKPQYGGAQVGRFIASVYDPEANSHLIAELLNRFVEEGDYGAGQELLLYGDAAAEALNGYLVKTDNPELATDILQILGDSGSQVAFRYIVQYFQQHSHVQTDPLGPPAAHALLYVITLNSGESVEFKPVLDETLFARLLQDPEYSQQAEHAIQAITDALNKTETPNPADAITPPAVRSHDPFGGL